MLIAKNISYHMGQNIILNDVTTPLSSGKITAILGPNGAGKSTLLKCLTGALTPSNGTVTLDSKPLAEYCLKALCIKRAVLSQTNPMSFPFTVLDIVMMGRNPYAAGRQSNEAHDIACQALQAVDALHLKTRIFPTLSGGEQQRVQLARVLTQIWKKKDTYLFLDEPTSALDLKHQHRILELAKKLTQNGVTVITILHDMNLAMAYADNVILLEKGTLYAAGKTIDILTPNTIRTVFEVEMLSVPHPKSNKTSLLLAA